MESPLGLRRTQARSFVLPFGHNTLNSPIWLVPFLLGACIEVRLYGLPQEQCRLTDLGITVGACMVQ